MVVNENENPMDGFENKNKKGGNGNVAFNEKNYLNVRLKDDEDRREIRIRTIPVSPDSKKHYSKIFMHSLKVNSLISKSGYKSYVCLSKTDGIDHDQLGNKCPLCEIYNGAWEEFNKLKDEIIRIGVDSPESEPLKAKQKEWTEIINSNKPIEVGIIRCIERGHEEDGPKFWKINLHSDKTDALNQIYNLYTTRRIESIEEHYNIDYSALSSDGIAELNKKMAADGFVPYNIMDCENGKDLKITIEAVYDKNGKRTNKTSIKVIEYGSSKPLSNDPEQAEKWINDTKKWNDVFVVKPYEYLSIIADGKYPFFDKTKGIWVEKEFNNKSEDLDERVASDRNIAEAASQARNLSSNVPNVDSELPF